MKRLFIALIILVSSLCLFAEPTYSSPSRQYILGYFGKDTYMTVSILEDALPFNIDSSTVKSVEVAGSTPSMVSGLRIGYYSLVTNDMNFSITVEHDKLTLFNGTPVTGQETSVDYRLYMFMEGSTFKSCLSTGSITINASDFPSAGNVSSNFLVAAQERSLYLTLAKSTNNLAGGDYESYITITVNGGV